MNDFKIKVPEYKGIYCFWSIVMVFLVSDCCVAISHTLLTRFIEMLISFSSKIWSCPHCQKHYYLV